MEHTLERLTTFLRLYDTERVALANTITAESLAELYAESNLLQDVLGRLVFPFVDRTARTRFLDRGSDAFAVAYRALGTTLPNLTELPIDYTEDGYRAAVDEERAQLAADREEMERQHRRVNALYSMLLDTLHREFGDRVVEVFKSVKEREAEALRDGILLIPEA